MVGGACSTAEPARSLEYICEMGGAGGMVGLLSGSASAIFLKSLEAVTKVRLEHAWLLFLLPVGELW